MSEVRTADPAQSAVSVPPVAPGLQTCTSAPSGTEAGATTNTATTTDLASAALPLRKREIKDEESRNSSEKIVEEKPLSQPLSQPLSPSANVPRSSSPPPTEKNDISVGALKSVKENCHQEATVAAAAAVAAADSAISSIVQLESKLSSIADIDSSAESNDMRDVWGKAVAYVEKNGVSVRKAAKQFGVSRSGLYRRVRKEVPLVTRPGPKGYLNDVQERTILYVLDTFEKHGLYLENAELRPLMRLVVECAGNDQIPSDFPGRKYISRFLQRHDKLTARQKRKEMDEMHNGALQRMKKPRRENGGTADPKSSPSLHSNIGSSSSTNSAKAGAESFPISTVSSLLSASPAQAAEVKTNNQKPSTTTVTNTGPKLEASHEPSASNGIESSPSVVVPRRKPSASLDSAKDSDEIAGPNSDTKPASSTTSSPSLGNATGTIMI